MVSFNITVPPGVKVEPQCCEKQSAFYRATGILMMSPDHDDFLERTTPGLCAAYEQFDQRTRGPIPSNLLESIDNSQWAPNVTMIDLEWQRMREPQEMSIDIAFNPFELGFSFEAMGMVIPNANFRGLFDCVEMFFHSPSLCLSQIGRRIKIEVCIGDVIEVFEQIRSGVVGHREAAMEASQEGDAARSTTDRADYPTKYDRIHLSNIPDYIGGTLTTFMYGLPLLWPDTASYITANCLRNPPRWQSLSHFNNEYIGLSSPMDLENTFQVKKLPHEDTGNPYPLTEYHKWRRAIKSKAQSDLIPRDRFETWLYRLFLKIAIPKSKEMSSYVMIYSPLNLTVFVRLCAHLATVGYPSHWTSGVLSSLCSGQITTKARPPRSEPLKIKEVKNELPVLSQSVAPFITEMTTLLSIYQSSLPFGVFAPQVPPLKAVHKYTCS
jgi:hypothetical protein